MKTNIKKHASLLMGIFILYLAIRYWDGAVNIFSMAVSAATPLIAGLAIAYILNILMSFYERHYFPKSKAVIVAKTRRIACMLLAFLSLIGIVALIIGIVVPELVNCTKHLFAEVPAAVMNLLAYMEQNDMIKQYVIMLEEYLVENFSGLEGKLMSGAQSVLSGVGGVMSSVVSVVGSAFSSVVTFLVAVIFSIYILLGKEKLGAQAKKLITTYFKKRADKIFYVVDALNDSFHHFIVGQCTEAVVLGVLCMVGMWIFRFPDHRLPKLRSREQYRLPTLYPIHQFLWLFCLLWITIPQTIPLVLSMKSLMFSCPMHLLYFDLPFLPQNCSMLYIRDTVPSI